MKFTQLPVATAILCALYPQISFAEQTTDVEANLEKIEIVGIRQNRISEGATGLALEIDETPQSISVISAEQLKNYSAFNINDALRLAPGINVEEWETNRTNYTSRGFEIKNTQIDGVGLPNDWGIVTGAMEAYGYEKIEVIRGANGLLTGVGNASGTLNYVRKRPKNENGGEIGVSVGSWDFKRLQADYSLLLTESGSWAARFVAAAEDKESYLDGLENNREFFSAVVDGQLTDNSTVTIGYSYQDADTDGNTWGGLVYNYTDGTQAKWDVSDTTTQEWTMWDTINTSAFVEYNYVFANAWQLQASYNFRGFEEQDKLFYAYGTIDKDTNLGLNGSPGRYDSEIDADLFEIKAFGAFELFGKEHQASFGVSHAKSDDVMYQHPFDFANTPAAGPTPAFPYDLDAIPEPEWLTPVLYSDIEQKLTRYFGSAQLNITDKLFTVVGFNAIEFERSGMNAGASIDNDESETSPYIGFTYKLNDDLNLYASYSDIYQPQEQADYNGQYLAPTKGTNFETGVKASWFDDALMTTFAYFTAEQDNFAQYAGLTEDGIYYYEGVSIESEGYEFEVTGKITDAMNIVASYTYIDVTDENGDDTNKWAPRDVVGVTVDYALTDAVVVGLNGRWQSKIESTDYNVKQGSYALLNAFARWNINDQVAVQANVNNITDEQYINSLQTVGYYGAPTNGSLTLTYKF
ncbi:TonB-dependent siderophore receptor [Pseudoalteromonas shioyasakiensis]|uniref:TonB-dependent siderophore receptor n=1 Tax=Pseudoalteromonas shioyasakiensis TaxID=1190813 RepID=UPI001EFC7B20|nr:TonB-dependent siderophore receptor [Pseudoalteromonas shioyasakiensis]MCG9734891.1 TonB-dependent siderophore receptor [Pseudoalteromonas shioyasakiensis]